jgi:hypothetical protein
LFLLLFSAAGGAVFGFVSPLSRDPEESLSQAVFIDAALPLGATHAMGTDDVDMHEPQAVQNAEGDAKSQEHKQSGLASPSPQRNFSQGSGSRRRIYADPPHSQQHSPEQRTLEQQLADTIKHYQQQMQQMQQMSDEHAAALQQQQTEAEERAAAAADSTCRVEELVRGMEQTHVNHVARVSDPQGLGAGSDATADALREIAELQAGLLAPSGKPHFYAVSLDTVEQWIADLEVLETALGGPFAPSQTPYLVSPEQAQTVVDHLRTMWSQLEEAPSDGLPFMRVLLLSKKLRCIDQLRPTDDEVEGQPPILWQVLELGALLAQVPAHDVMWSYLLRWPCHFFERGAWQLMDRAASKYARAAMAAFSDVGQQARLLVEQCKALERIDQLHRAQYLGANVLVLQYPEAPLQLLHDLHTKHSPAAGPPPDRDLLQLFEERSGWSEDDWARECADAETHAAELESQLQLDEAAGVLRKKILKKQRRHAERARNKADMLAARPHSFTAAMKKSLRFFHSDKRTGSAGEDAEFAQAKEAWDQLDACRISFQQLRAFQEQVAAAMEQ